MPPFCICSSGCGRAGASERPVQGLLMIAASSAGAVAQSTEACAHRRPRSSRGGTSAPVQFAALVQVTQLHGAVPTAAS